MNRLSIIIAVFNGAETLEACLQSCFMQSHDDLEVIVIDGGSTDGTCKILELYDNKIKYWVSEQDNGIYHAWNKGVRASSGEWLCFLGADDVWASPQAAARLVNLAADGRANLVCGKNAKHASAFRPAYTFGEPWNRKRMLCYMTIAHAGTLHRRNLIEQFGYFDESYRVAGDYDFLLRASDAVVANYLAEVVVFMGGSGVSSTMLRKARDESVQALRRSKAGGAFAAGRFWLRFNTRHALALLRFAK